MDLRRILAADFRTPPEFQGLQLAQRSAGQIGGVRLELTAAHGKTRLGACYQQVPVRVLRPFQPASEPAALLYLLNPTAGLMDGDGHLLEMHIQAGVRAVVTGQSATRVHPAWQGFATQQWRIRVEEDAQLVVLPGPVIPFRGCRYYQRVVIELAATARLVWGDVWLPGRYARGEQSEAFQFERMIQDVVVRREGVLIWRERFCWAGPWDADMVRWHLGSQTAAGSLFVTGPVAEMSGVKTLPADVAVLPLASGDTCLRLCASPAEVIRGVVSMALRHTASWSPGSSDRPWFLHSHNLAPNHWFSSLDHQDGVER